MPQGKPRIDPANALPAQRPRVADYAKEKLRLYFDPRARHVLLNVESRAVIDACAAVLQAYEQYVENPNPDIPRSIARAIVQGMLDADDWVI
jgi:hypothetical protein